MNLESPKAEGMAERVREVRAQQEEGGRELKGYCTVDVAIQRCGTWRR